MKKTAARIFAVLFMIMLFAGAALAAGPVSTYLTFRITQQAPSSVVNVGQDLQIEVGINGVEPTSYQWYFEGKPITANGNQRVYNIVNARPEDAGIYRMQAYEDDRLVLSVDVNVRVVDTAHLPASGDETLPVAFAFAAAGMALVGMAFVVRRRRMA